MKKLRVAVLFGGRSPEHEVSLRSAENVIQYLDPNLFEVVPIGVDKAGSWSLGEGIFAKSLAQNVVPQLEESAWFAPTWICKPVSESKQLSPTTKSSSMFDVIFPAVHGLFGEDGTLQGLLELAELPYVGCGVLASAVGMDKDVSKRLSLQAGIPVAPYEVIKKDFFVKNKHSVCEIIEKKLYFPVFVKPANTGSSIGITKVKQKSDLMAALEVAFRFDQKVLVEKALDIFELEVAVLESLTDKENPIVSVVGEIKPNHEFYSYDAKYLDENGAELLIPAPISVDLQNKAKEIAKSLFIILECEGMARIDLFLDKNNSTIYFNEINTIPGFTPISMYPKLMAASGMSYSALLTHLIQLAMLRHEAKAALQRSYIEA